jgi:hypothetical protein
MILSNQKDKSYESKSNLLIWLYKSILSFILIISFSLSFLAIPLTFGNIETNAAASTDPADSLDDFYITDGLRQNFRTDFQHLVISQTILEEPTIELQTMQIPVGQADLKIYRADKSTLLDFLTHDSKNKQINELDLTKLSLIENLTADVKNNIDKTFSTSGKIKLNAQAVGVYVIWAKFKSKIQTTILIRSNFGTVTTNDAKNLIFWTQNLSTNKSAQSGTVTTYNLLKDPSSLGNGTISNIGISNIPKNPKSEIALIDIDGDISLVPISEFQSSQRLDLLSNIDEYNHFYTFVDRPIYLPGQTINFKLIQRTEKDLNWSIPSGKITVRPECNYCKDSPKNPFETKGFDLSKNGTINGEFKIPEDITTGSYYLSINGNQNGSSISFQGATWFNIVNYNNPGNFTEATPGPIMNDNPFLINPTSSKISLKLDKDKYQVGDEAILTISSKALNQDFFMLAGRSQANNYQIVNLKSDQTQVKIPVKDADVPILKVQVSSFIDNKLETTGTVLNINTTNREIQTSIKPDKENYNPGDTVNLEITTENQGKPISAEVSLNVIDKTLYNTSKPNQSIGSAFYGQLFYNIPYSNSLLPIYNNSADGIDWNPGDEINTPDKNQYAFSPFNFWNPNLKTDSNGKVTISFKLPETFATWVIDTSSLAYDDRPITSQSKIEISTDNSTPLPNTITNIPLPTTEINVSDKSPLNTINPSTQITKSDNDIEVLSTASNNQTVELITKSAIILALVILCFGFAILVLILILTIRKPHINNIKDLVKDLRYEFEKYHALTSQSIANGNFNPFKSLLSHEEVAKLVTKEPSAVVIHPDETDVRHLPEKDENEIAVAEIIEQKPTLAQIKQTKSAINKTKVDNKTSKSKLTKNAKAKKVTEKSLKEIKEDLKKSV